MEWKWNRRSSHSTVAEYEVKICALCGALNHERNDECLICSWQGTFLNDTKLVHIAWQRLYDQFEQVSLKHVTLRQRSSKVLLGEDRIVKPFWLRCRQLWEHCRHVALRNRMRSRKMASAPVIPPINQAQ